MLLLAGRSSHYKTFRGLPQTILLASIWRAGWSTGYTLELCTAGLWGFFTNSKSVAPDLEQGTGFLKLGSRHNSQLLPHAMWVQKSSCNHAELLFWRNKGVLHCRHMDPAMPLWDQAACPPSTACCSVNLLPYLGLAQRSLACLSLLGGDMPWARAFLGVEFFPSFVPAKLQQCLFHVVPWGFPL